MHKKRILFHGSPNYFKEFDANLIGRENGTANGRGFYFTTCAINASGFCGSKNDGYVFTCEVNLQGKELSLVDKEITMNEYYKIFATMRRIYSKLNGRYFLSDYFDLTWTSEYRAFVDFLDNSYTSSECDVDIFNECIHLFGDFELVACVFNLFGYTHSVKYHNEDVQHYIIFSNKNIKILKIQIYPDWVLESHAKWLLEREGS